MNRSALVSLGIAGTLMAVTSQAGTYSRTSVCSIDVACHPGVPDEDQGVIINADGVVYPISYLPAGTSPNLKVCIEAGFSGALVPIAEWAIEKWNALAPTTENCLGCKRNEIPDPDPDGPKSAASTLLHELGHCAMGLGHTTLIIGEPLPITPPPPRKHTSWTMSYDGARIGLTIGADNIRGSFDDLQFGPGMGQPFATNVFWFRTQDNNPVIIDSTAIQSTTYTYDMDQLPSGHNWPANANHWVTTDPLLGFAPETVAVMTDTQRTGEVKFDLTADDVNMVKMSRTGVDRLVGGVDDHQIQIDVVPCTGAEDFKIRVGATVSSSNLAECSVFMGFVFPNDPHGSAEAYKLLRTEGVNAAKITLNEDKVWDLRIPLWWNGFESGTTNHWSDVEP